MSELRAKAVDAASRVVVTCDVLATLVADTDIEGDVPALRGYLVETVIPELSR